jgi:hypothetical protein
MNWRSKLKESCKTCKFFWIWYGLGKENEKDYPEWTHTFCRKYAPRKMEKGEMNFPEVNEDFWCGDYRLKKETK